MRSLKNTHQLQIAMKRIERAYDDTLEALGAEPARKFQTKKLMS